MTDDVTTASKLTMTLINAALLAAVTLGTACFPSHVPIDEGQTATIDSRLLGRWVIDPQYEGKAEFQEVVATLDGRTYQVKEIAPTASADPNAPPSTLTQTFFSSEVDGAVFLNLGIRNRYFLYQYDFPDAKHLRLWTLSGELLSKWQGAKGLSGWPETSEELRTYVEANHTDPAFLDEEPYMILHRPLRERGEPRRRFRRTVTRRESADDEHRDEQSNPN